MDESSERPDDHLPWVRDNDRMPGRAASAYVRIPVEIVKAPPREAEPEDELAEPSSPVQPETPTTAPEPEPAAVGRRRPRRESRRPSSSESRRIEPVSWVVPGLPLAAALPGLLALLGMFLASVALATAAAMALLPVPARFAAAIVAAIFLGLLAYPAGRWTLALSGLHPLRLESLEGLASVRSATLAALGRRAELQTLASARSNAGELIRAREALGRFLTSHPVGRRGDDGPWTAVGLSAETLKRRKDELLSPRRLAADEGDRPADWLRSFEEGFLEPLDASARRRVEEHAWRTFKATAASSNEGVDAMVILSSGSAMLEELGRIYDLRVGRVGGAVLLARLLVDNELAGRSDRPESRGETVIERADGGGGQGDGISPECGFRAVLERHPIPPDAAEIESLLGRGARAFGLRAESALLHYFLMRQLGARAVGLMQPMTRR
jgi:hypothetical protein